MITGELKQQIDGIWNTFWTGGISNTITIVEQLTYLMFIKDLDENETRNEKKEERFGTQFKHTFGPEEQKFRWKNLKEMNVEERHAIFSNTEEGIFPFIRSLGKEQSLFSKYMRGANFGISKPAVLDQVMEKLERIGMDDQDTKGDVYEYLLSKLEDNGTAGQFRTPRHIIKLMVELMQPQLDDRICDPSAGTSGFLVSAKEYIDKQYSAVERDNNSDHINREMFNGSEFDATMLRIASMNLYLHGVEEPKIEDVDAVSKDNTIADAYTLIMANPPFKGKIDKESIAGGLKNVTNTTKTELLFLALILRELKTGGRAAVIVPDGVLFGASKAHKSIRKELVENQKLDGVISMPSGVFKPYAGVSTAILLFTKTDSGGTDKVWFYDMKADGKSLDDKRNLLVDEGLFEDFAFGKDKLKTEEMAKMVNQHENFNLPQILDHYRYLKSDYWGKMHDENGHLIQVQDIPKNLGFDDFLDDTCIHDFADRKSQSFLVTQEEIKENDWDLSINRYKEIEYKEVDYDPPKEILERIGKLDDERKGIMEKLGKVSK